MQVCPSSVGLSASCCSALAEAAGPDAQQVEALSSGLAPCSGDKPRLVRTISVVGPATPDGGAAAAPPPHQAREAGAAAAPHGASEEAADAGAALVSDDELLVEEPRDPRAMR